MPINAAGIYYISHKCDFSIYFISSFLQFTLNRRSPEVNYANDSKVNSTKQDQML